MLPTYTVYIITIASSAAASAHASRDSMVSRDPCWSGGIHSPCNGAETGCTPDGILVSVILFLRNLHFTTWAWAMHTDGYNVTRCIAMVKTKWFSPTSAAARLIREAVITMMTATLHANECCDIAHKGPRSKKWSLERKAELSFREGSGSMGGTRCCYPIPLIYIRFLLLDSESSNTIIVIKKRNHPCLKFSVSQFV